MKNSAVDYWGKIGISYSNVWQGEARKLMSRKEMGFITKYLDKIRPKKVLDVGFGTGRILETYRQNLAKNAEIYGIDISSKMARLCRRRYQREQKIKSLKVANAGLISIKFHGEFDFITAIRILKYNPDWREILDGICQKLSKGGVIIFTMPNKFSINRWARTDYPIERSDVQEIKKLIANFGLKTLEIRGFSWLPDYFYDVPFKNNWWYVRFLEKAENLCGQVFGGTRFSRILFIACQKK